MGMSTAFRYAERQGDPERRALRAMPPEPGSELQRLRDENRRLAVSLGGFSAFIASKGLLEEAWDYVNAIHQLDDE
jgi:hypothetical protein